MWNPTTLLLLFALLQVQCWNVFHFGRHTEGGFGRPYGDNSVPDAGTDDDFPDLWFTQKLDHFDSNNNDTWNQVRN